MKVKHLLTLFTTVFLLFACKTHHIPQQLELIKLGSAEYYDTAVINKPGAEKYFLYTQGKDSLLSKECEQSSDNVTDLVHGEKLHCKYYTSAITQNQKDKFEFMIKYLGQIPEGRLPNNQRDPEWEGCDLFGSWLAIFSDSAGAKHYYSFLRVNLPREIFDLCTDLSWPDYSEGPTAINAINTDSLVELSLSKHVGRNISDLLTPPLHANSKFPAEPVKP